MEVIEKDALKFSETIKEISSLKKIKLGNFSIPIKKSNIGRIWYNQDDFEFIKSTHDYKVQLFDGTLELSLQLYRNVNNHYRLRTISRINGVEGQLFSVNLTTEKDAKKGIFLVQKIKFVEQYKGNKLLAKKHRKMKQVVLCDLLKKLNFDVTDNNDVILGIYNLKERCFVNTTPESFLNDFITISILKGHFMGNKGYELEILPSFMLIDSRKKIESRVIDEKDLPTRIASRRRKRNIPLGLRFKVLERDKGKCKLCGRSPKEGIKLHVDHIDPFSKGGLTILENLQTLCDECNIGKSNKSSRKY